MDDDGGRPPGTLLSRAEERLEVRRGLRGCLGGEEPMIVLQPTVALSTGRIIGAEALVRRPGAGRDADMDDTAIALAGRWILTNACAEVQATRRHVGRAAPIGVSVTLSTAQLSAADLVADVSTALRVSGLAPGDLCIQIAEPALDQQPTSTLSAIDVLHGMGVRTALNCFSAGYGSMLYVQHFRVDVIRIDAALMGETVAGTVQPEVVRAAIGIAHDLGARVVAVSMDSAVQVEALAELGCDAGQGRYFAEPLAIPEFELLCAQEQRQWAVA